MSGNRRTGAVCAVQSGRCTRRTVHAAARRLVAGAGRSGRRDGATCTRRPGDVDLARLARTTAGDVRAPYALRCTEGFTAESRARSHVLPMTARCSSPAAQRRSLAGIGWDALRDARRRGATLIYAQRTADGRIALGGRGHPLPGRYRHRPRRGDRDRGPSRRSGRNTAPGFPGAAAAAWNTPVRRARRARDGAPRSPGRQGGWLGGG